MQIEHGWWPPFKRSRKGGNQTAWTLTTNERSGSTVMIRAARIAATHEDTPFKPLVSARHCPR
jgi:hypothetical protein